MKRDPFYQELIRALDGPLDEDDFELAASYALRTIYPTLVPVRGGSDSGMDGAIADGEGRAFPLVVTTSKDAIGNLTRNLEKYTRDGGPRRVAVFATSRALTQKRRANLETRAEQLGFQLVQVHDQSAFAELFYYRPEICSSLLGLTPRPPGLSEVPLTRRPVIGISLIGWGDRHGTIAGRFGRPRRHGPTRERQDSDSQVSRCRGMGNVRGEFGRGESDL